MSLIQQPWDEAGPQKTPLGRTTDITTKGRLLLRFFGTKPDHSKHP